MPNYQNKLKIFKIFALVLLAALILLVIILRITTINHYYDLSKKYAEKYGLSHALVLSCIKVESNFNKDACSSKNACGLMQLTPSTFKYSAELANIEGELDIFDEKTNVELGCNYLSYLIHKFNSEKLAVCAYNAGEGNVINWLKNENYSKDGKALDEIPFPETKAYLSKVAFYKKLFQKVYKIS